MAKEVIVANKLLRAHIAGIIFYPQMKPEIKILSSSIPSEVRPTY